MSKLSRRSFCRVAGGGLAALSTSSKIWAGAPPMITAREIMARMSREVGVKPFWPTADTIKIGDPDAAVTGVTTTFMSTLDVLQRSHEAGNNFVISHEPTFWSSSDVVADLRDDPLYKFKVDFCEANRMVVMRYHDTWHARRPDGIFAGFNRWTGWQQYLYHEPGNERGNFYKLPLTTAGEIARHLTVKLNQRSVRLVGDPETPVTKVGFAGHYISECMKIAPKVDLIIAGESREWECAEYMRDAVALGEKKAYIQLSHEGMEEAGMDECANWLKGFVKEVPVQFIASGDPFWIPA
jgi:putative NIF3 family GTP cyclohydrolase 1 type 2